MVTTIIVYKKDSINIQTFDRDNNVLCLCMQCIIYRDVMFVQADPDSPSVVQRISSATVHLRSAFRSAPSEQVMYFVCIVNVEHQYLLSIISKANRPIIIIYY